ncbi:prolipoprotein diacylglyceryl transferase [candidate division WWE3 bacterium]|nr:prolipoprotein diacylglyceryl transferase [candidate division WWE3 bacterium]
MFSIPSQLIISGVSINSFGIFLFFGFLLLAFTVWSEGKKDGFDEERLFDMLLVSSFISILFSRTFFALDHSVTAGAFFLQIVRVWTPGFNLLGALIGFILPIFLFCRSWNWSFYHIIDIFSMGLALAFSAVALGYIGLQAKFNFLFGFAAWIFVYALLARLRTTKLRSGYGFCLFTVLNTALGIYFFGVKDNLIFYCVLVTLGFIVFGFRWRISHDEVVARIISRIKK